MDQILELKDSTEEHGEKILSQNQEFYLLENLKRFLKTRQTSKPWYSQINFPLANNAIIPTDFVNLYSAEEGSFISTISDITAKKTDRYACTLQFDSWLNILAKTNEPLKKIVESLNTCIFDQYGEWYISAVFSQYKSKTRSLEICSVGTCYAFLLQHDTGILQTIDFCDPLGMQKNFVFTSKSFIVEPGDIFFACTDGVYNSKNNNGKALGKDFLQNLIKSCQMMSIYTQVEKIQNILTQKHSQGVIQDDRTIQFIKFQ